MTLTGSGFTDKTKVTLIVEKEGIKPTKVESADDGNSLKVTLPKIELKSNICDGGDGKDVVMTIRIFGVGDAAEKYGKMRTRLPTRNHHCARGHGWVHFAICFS